jgi:hypothetical protein
MLIQDRFTRDLIAEAIRSTVDEVVSDQMSGISQEPQITSRVGQAIEARLNGANVNGYHIRAITQDIPDRGRGSLEKRTGIDLYLGVEVASPSGETVSKGIFVQSKLQDSLGYPSDHRDLRRQCEKMVIRSDKGSYVWIYGPNGVRVVPASEVATQTKMSPTSLGSRSVGELFQNVFDCFAGDQRHANPDIFRSRAALGEMLQELGAQNGVALTIAPIR